MRPNGHLRASGGVRLADLAETLGRLDHTRYEGRILAVRGLMVEASGPPQALALGARAVVETAGGPTRLEIVGYRDGRALLMPFENVEGLRAGASLTFEGSSPMIAPSSAWLGRVIDAFGQPVDGGPPVANGSHPRLVRGVPPPAHTRIRVGGRMETGIRAIDAFCALCQGQRMGIFAGSGVGKSVLLSQLAKGAQADVVVIGLIGERGREVREFLEDTLGPEGLRRSVVVVATSDESSLKRRQAAYTTLAVAEHFRDQGLQVLCLLDSVTRFAMAQREIGLATGEPPTTKGYTPTVFAELPKLLERAGPGAPTGQDQIGSITGLFTVLVDGGDHDEPVADAVRGILDGHLVLERAIAERGRFPALNILKSVSRLMPECHSLEEQHLVREAKRALAAYSDMEELIRLGAYRRGADPVTDRAITLAEPLEIFLSQGKHERSGFDETFQRLADILAIEG
ncbi:flagellum-specific ATP synthase [Candidatus Phycosocius bacilliformis]|uniref:Flagellum-specific ATP synthase n=1 Tax=Candidatus Phycosocius bacilliformis TaxID=1445552 RepID=A0A2P2E6N0_9PROT|nr:flagellar protein export ATPase FliI [Candidatus Phycosocius bacilliformis]GBF56708.1 flagellum-specific ATP synthase [Candidatus Phycosocius bacilliformis]